MDESAILACLDTGLFTSRGADRLGWAHQTYAEFLAARFLSSAPLVQLQSLLSIEALAGSYVIPQLHETAAWLAGLRRDVSEWIASVEPEVLLRSDVAALDDATKEPLVAALLKRFVAEELFDTEDIRGGYERLCHPRLTEQLAPAIQARTLGVIARRAAIDIAEACSVRQVQDILVDVALDPSEPHPVRTQAAHAVWRIGDGGAKDRLSPLALDGKNDDPDDDLQGIALRCLWPGRLASADVAKALALIRNS